MPEILRVGSIEATSDNARTIQRFTLQDLRRMGIPYRQATAHADSINPQLVEQQRSNLAEHPERYLGATALSGGGLLGFVKLNTWSPFDEVSASSGLRKLEYGVRVRMMGNHMPEVTLGIFALIADYTLHQDLRRRILAKLVDGAVEQADATLTGVVDTTGVAMRISLTPDDPARDILESRGFEPTGIKGKPIADVVQEIYSRQAVIS